MYWTSFKVIGHSSKNVGPSQKHFAPPGDPSWLRAWSRRLGEGQSNWGARRRSSLA